MIGCREEVVRRNSRSFGDTNIDSDLVVGTELWDVMSFTLDGWRSLARMRSVVQ